MRIFGDDSPFRAKWEDMNREYSWYAALQAKGNKLANWSDLPLLTHERLLAYYAEGEKNSGPDWNVYLTSGTSGKKRKAIYYDAADEQVYVKQKTALFAELMKGLEAKRALSDMGTGHAEATATEIFEALGLACESVPFGLPVTEHLLRLEQFRPDVLYTMPSLLDGLIRVAPTNFEWGVKRVILVGEPAPPEWRYRIAEQLGINGRDVVDTYGSIEIGTIAYYDADRGRYILLEGLVAEGVSPSEVDLPDVKLPHGEQILVLSSFVRRRFPALRYVTYDVVRDLLIEEIDGKLMTTFAAIVKRVGPELKHGEKISIYDVENAVFKHMRQAEVRVLVHGKKLQVNITVSTPSPVDEVIKSAVRTELHNAIPEIGAMIHGGLLEEMIVNFDYSSEPGTVGEATGTVVRVKQKRLYIQDDGEGTGSN